MTAASRERAEAARILHQVIGGGRTTDQAMAAADVSPLCRELVFGSLRHYFSLASLVTEALHQPIKQKDREIWALMIVGAYQLKYLRVPDHAAIFETVTASRDLQRPWARGLVNAVLRRIAALPDPDDRSLEHPAWLDARLRRQYPDAQSIMTANNARAPMALRVNQARITPAEYRARLSAAGMAARPAGSQDGSAETALGPESLILEAPVKVASLPGYREGLVSVQDAGAQFAAALLEPGAGERVLDACSAPGGKLFHLLERYPTASYSALELSAVRLQHVLEEAARLGHRNFAAREADAALLDWWDGTPFRHILLDAPCSGTGTLRRHPDIKVLRRESDLAEAAALQRRLLANLWRVLEPGGTLLYCTCSILAAENDEVIDTVLQEQSDARIAALRLSSGRPTRHGWQLLPTDPDTDGFYYARMTKAVAA